MRDAPHIDSLVLLRCRWLAFIATGAGGVVGVAEAQHVLLAIAMMLRGETGPEERPRLRPAEAGGKRLWVLQEGR
jgi:hypothetical protein